MKTKELLFIAVVGLFAGVTGSYIVEWISDEKKEDSAERTTEYEREGALKNKKISSLSLKNASRIGDLESKYSVLLSNTKTRSDETHEDVYYEDEIPTQEVLEREREELRIKHNNIAETISNETVDPEWSKYAENELNTKLNEFAETGGYKVLGTTCHSTSCSSRLMFDNYDGAMANAQRILYRKYEVNCITRLNIPRPENPHERYETNILFTDCLRDN